MLQNSQEVVFRLSAPKCYHSTLLKEKYNYDPNIIIFTPTPPGDNKNRKYYKENQWLKWREMKNKKFLYALGLHISIEKSALKLNFSIIKRNKNNDSPNMGS